MLRIPLLARLGLLLGCASVAHPARLGAGTRLPIEVSETAGIRRFSYPVSAELELDPPAVAGAHFRLLDDGRPVPAQLRTLEERDGRAARVALDFELSCLPFASRRYEVEHGSDVPTGPEPGSGLELEERGDVFAIRNGGQITYEVPRDLAELLRSVRIPRGDFIAPGVPGLLLARRGGDPTLEPLRAELRARVTRRGPLAVGLRWDGVADLGGGARVPVTVELEIPRAKSWARVLFRIEDAGGLVSRIGAALRLRLEKGEAFADFGAGGFVYAAIPGGQAVELRAGSLAPGADEAKPSWEVRRGPLAALEPYVTAPPGKTAGRAEGWAHLMDRTSAAAIAVASFGERTGDRILLEATGRIEVSRPPRQRRRVALRSAGARFAVHLVDSPPHVGAVTSPQSMAAPLAVTRLDGERR